MESLFWISAFMLFYAFAGYPLSLKLLNVLFGRNKRNLSGSLPSISMILSAYNEESVILEKLANFEALDYPRERLEFIIVSDGSTDRTAELINEAGISGVRLLVQERNMGKTAALNRAVSESSGDILVFTDANSMFDRGVLRTFAAGFSDPEVGLVSGRTEYTGGGAGAYRRYEDWIKTLESGLWGIVGADGAIYAMRRSLYTQLEPQFINDFLHPLQNVIQGYSAIQDSAAICREPMEPVGAGELGRQTRIMAQSWIIVFAQIPELIRSARWGLLWQLFSHKLLRWFTVPLMLALLMANFTLVGRGLFFDFTLVVQVFFYFSAWFFRHSEGGIKKLPFSFLLLHYSALTGLVQYLRGEKYISWNPRHN